MATPEDRARRILGLSHREHPRERAQRILETATAAQDAARVGNRPLPEREEGPSILGRMFGSLHSVLDVPGTLGGLLVSRFSPAEEHREFVAEATRERLGELVAVEGAFGHMALTEPGANAINLLGLVSEKVTPGLAREGRGPAPMFFDLAENIRTFGEDTSRRMFQFAHNRGLPSDRLLGASALGGVLGFASPLIGSFKLAGGVVPLLRSEKLTRGMPGFFVRDGAAGMIFGGVFQEGDLTERLMESGKEAAYFSAFTIGLLGIFGTMSGFRNVRLTQKERLLNERMNPLNRLEWDPETGLYRMARLDERQARILTDVLSEEQYISQSAGAQRLLEQGKNHAAVIAGARAVARGEADVFVVRGVESSERLAAEIASEFPDMNVAFIRRGGGYDLIGSKKKMPKEIREKYRRDGYFKGQRVDMDGVQYEFVQRHGKGPKVKIKDPDSGEIKIVDEALLRPLPYGTGLVEVRPALVDRFIEWYTKKIDDLAATRGTTKEHELVRQAREGKLNPRERRDIREPEMLINQEEVGFSDEVLQQFNQLVDQRIQELMARQDIPDHIKQIGIEKFERMRREAPQNVLQEIASRGRENVLEMPIREPVTFEEAARLFLRENKIAGVDADEFVAYAAQEVRQHVWKSLPKTEQKLIKQLKDEYFQQLSTRVNDLDHHASIRGFKVIRESDGTVTLRDVNSGFAQNYKNERSALEAAKRANRDVMDDVMSILPRETLTGPPISRGGDVPDGWWSMPKDKVDVKLSGANPWFGGAFKNIRDRLLQVEEAIGVPIFTRVFDEIDAGIQSMNKILDIDGRFINEAFEGLNKNERIKLAAWWQTVHNTPLSRAERIRVGREMGLVGRHFSVDAKIRRVMNRMGVDTGMPGEQYFDEFFGRIRPYVERTGAPISETTLQRMYPNGVPDDMRKLYDAARRTELSHLERDPLIVAHRYARSVRFNQHAGEPWRRLRSLTDESNPFGLYDLPVEQQRLMLEAFGGADNGIGLERVKAFRGFLREWSTRLRGYPDQDIKTVRSFVVNFAQKLGFRIDERLGEELIGMLLSLQYGSAIGFAPMMLARNLTQQIWMGFTRYGGKWTVEAIRRALTFDGLKAADDAGALRTQAKGSLLGEEIYRDFIVEAPIKGTNWASSMVAGFANKLIQGAELGRRTSSRFMTLYGSTDDFSRAWAFHEARLVAKDALQAWRAGSLNRDEFLRRAMPGHSRVIKEEFVERLNRFGDKDALDWIGVQGANENHFIYGTMAQPLWMQSTYGKPFSVFGSWPLWNKEAWIRAWRNMDAKERFLFAARNTIVAGAIGNMSYQFGVSLWNWMAPAGLLWTGGPITDQLINIKELIDAPMDRKAAAAYRLASTIGYLAYPGQRVVRDFTQAFELSDDMADVAIMVMLGRPEKSKLNYTDFMVDMPMGQQPLFGEQDPDNETYQRYLEYLESHELANQARQRQSPPAALPPSTGGRSNQSPNARP